MKAVFLSILLVISGAFAGCLNFDDDEEPEFFGEVYWQENGVALIWVDEWLYYGLPKINGGCDEWNVILDAEIDWDKFTVEEGQPIGDVCFDVARDEKHVSTYTGDYFEICIVGDEDEENLCYDIHLIDGGIIRYYEENEECVPQSSDIREPSGEYETAPGLLVDDEEWHEEFADFVSDSQDAAEEIGCLTLLYGPEDPIDEDDTEDYPRCEMIWPEDAFKAAIYSFIAEYELQYGPSIGCFFDDYADQTYGDIAYELEDNFSLSDALEYAQNWVDTNAQDYGQETFDLSTEFNIAGGGLGHINGTTQPEPVECSESGDETPAQSTNSSIFTIQDNPHVNQSGMACFTKYVEVFGLGVYAESGLSDEQVLHAADVLAELLDNDEDGVVDDQALLSRLQDMNALVPMFNSEEIHESPALLDFEENYNGNGVGAVLFANEVDPENPGLWGSDATIEEIMHTINHIGHVPLYPDAFGLQPNSSLLSDAMDEARGGQFIEHPGEYPEDAWYHYDDVTCEYDCMAIEYLYWAQVANMGLLNDTETCEGIDNEWQSCSKELLESMDVLIYALVTDPQYMLPQIAPDGQYNPK
ncbi:hypothetical protein N9M84_02915 [Candidatus Poseidoniales archaeon]|nr:hypothetical protein [Candidatus Poseidoniales archaeon]MDC3317029.1 hypothetical protein [Candidatus Poseidoniaceae archaeon]